MQGLRSILYTATLAAVSALILGPGGADEWPQWGHDASKNMVSPETHVPDDFDPGDYVGNTDEIDLATTRNVKWVAKLGSQSYGNPTVAGGRVFVGTNNESPRNPKLTGDRSVVMCFDAETGRFLWQLAIPKLGAGKVSDWEYLGICSSPTVDGDRVYVVSNRCEVLCLDVDGMANGNDGPFQDEGAYLAGPGKPPIEVGPTDGDILWKFDMREELGVFPHNITSSSILIVGDKLFATTSNGVDWSHTNIPAPNAPCLIMLDKNTGELLAEEASGISRRLLHSNWSSPAFAPIGPKGLVIFGAGDGFCYGFSTEPTRDEDGYPVLREVWRFDCNPSRYRVKNGKPVKYATPEGPSEVIATPVVYENRVYVAIGQDPEHGEGLGNLSCIDATQTGDITRTGRVWSNDKIHRSISTASVADGLVYIADYSGYVYCFDAETGKLYWTHDTQSHIWGSTVVADGKVYMGNEDGILTVLKAGKELKVLREIEMDSPLYSSPVIADGVLYITTPTHLYAVQSGGR